MAHFMFLSTAYPILFYANTKLVYVLEYTIPMHSKLRLII